MDAGLSIIACLVLAGAFGFLWRETVNFEDAHERDASRHH
jgi:hypothetical protein